MIVQRCFIDFVSDLINDSHDENFVVLPFAFFFFKHSPILIRSLGVRNRYMDVVSLVLSVRGGICWVSVPFKTVCSCVTSFSLVGDLQG